MDCFVASLPCANASRLSQAMTGGECAETKLLRRRLQFHPLRTHGAELEFGDLAKGVERGMAQQVGRRFCVAERHEHHVFRYVAVGAYLDLDGAAARLQADEIAGPNAQAPPVLARHERHSLRLDLV